MRPLRVKPLHQPLHEVPLVKVALDKPHLQQPSQRITFGRHELFCNHIQKPLEKGTELPVCARPIPADMRVHNLIEVALWHRETMLDEEPIYLILCGW